LDGDKPKKAGGAGDDDDDSGSFVVAHPDASPDHHDDEHQDHDGDVDIKEGLGSGAPEHVELYADLDNHGSPPIRIGSPKRSPVRSLAAHSSTPASRQSIKGLLRSRNHVKSSKKLAWADEVKFCTLHPTPCTLHPAPYTLHPTPYTLQLIPSKS